MVMKSSIFIGDFLIFYGHNTGVEIWKGVIWDGMFVMLYIYMDSHCLLLTCIASIGYTFCMQWDTVLHPRVAPVIGLHQLLHVDCKATGQAGPYF